MNEERVVRGHAEKVGAVEMEIGQIRRMLKDATIGRDRLRCTWGKPPRSASFPNACASFSSAQTIIIDYPSARIACNR